MPRLAEWQNCPDWVMQKAYSREPSCAGVWAGTGIGEAAFYSCVYPTPADFARYPVQLAEAYFREGLGEFVLPCEAVRTAAAPDDALLAFLQSACEAAAETGKWDRAALDYPVGQFENPRAV